MGRKKTWRLVVVMAAVSLMCLLLVVTGCSKEAEEQVVTKEMKQSFDLETGQHVDVTLESNPSTGYSWQVAQSPDSKMVELVSNHFVEPSDGDMVGAPGEEVWQFKAVGAGTTTMVLEYAQAWDTETPPEKRYTLTFNVTQADNEISGSFKIEVGKTFDLTLETNPSTGYSWQLSQQPDAKILKLVSSDVSGGGAAGAPQQQVWKFEGVGAGSTSFVLEYKGPGADAPVEKKYTAKVTVTAPPQPSPTPPKTYTDPAVPITVERGEIFILQVTNQAGTAYQWQLAEEINTSMLKFMGSDTWTSGTEPGSESVTDFTFEGLGPGNQIIKLGLFEAGEDEPSQEVQFNVTIK